MAITLQRAKVSVDLGTIVNSAVTSVKNVRKTEQARKESEFQKAVAAGMSYEAQLKFREEQLKSEKDSSFSDPTYISSLESSIENTKKLSRFEKIRSKYKKSLDDYIGGKESISSHLDILENLYNTEQDPDMRSEIRTLISEANKEKTTIELNAIKNRAIVATKDNSLTLIEDSIREITNKRSNAAIAENDDEVAMWDDTLLALNSSKSKIKIEDGLNEISFQTNKSNLKAGDKLGMLNNYISSSDVASPVIYDGITYDSLKAFWESKRGEYINSSYLDEVKKELDAQTSTIAASSKLGQIPVTRIQAVSDFYNDLKTKPGFEAYADKVEQYRVNDVNLMVTDLAESIYAEADTTGDTTKAQNAVLNLESKFGIKVSRQAFETEPKGVADVTLEESKTIKEPAKITPTVGTEGTYTVGEGESLSKIASQNKMSLSSLLDLNPEYKTNPNIVKAGSTIKISQPKEETITPPATITPAPEKVISTPTPTITPESQQTSKTYVVKPGENLSSIAKNVLGDASRWKELKTESGEAFDDSTAKKLQIGTKLVIPA